MILEYYNFYQKCVMALRGSRAMDNTKDSLTKSIWHSNLPSRNLFKIMKNNY